MFDSYFHQKKRKNKKKGKNEQAYLYVNYKIQLVSFSRMPCAVMCLLNILSQTAGEAVRARATSGNLARDQFRGSGEGESLKRRCKGG